MKVEIKKENYDLIVNKRKHHQKQEAKTRAELYDTRVSSS